VTEQLLSTLPLEDQKRLLPSLKPVTLSLGEVVYESGARQDSVYFPSTSIVSLLYTMTNGSMSEMGLVGNDGVVGIALFLGGETAPNRAVVQIAGHALKMSAQVLREEFARGGPFQFMLLRYTQALITQISQTAVCNSQHPVEQRLCRLLLLIHDRIGSEELPMTQEIISGMLGDRRESVSIAAAGLQAEGLLRYTRGQIKILDRQGLERKVCECYGIVRAEVKRLLAVGKGPV
jgi:CRP-like cAMP-binding protein